MFSFSSPFKASSPAVTPTPSNPHSPPSTPRSNNKADDVAGGGQFLTCDTSPIRTALPPSSAPATPFTLMRSPIPANRRQSSGLNNFSNSLFSSPTPPVLHFAKSPKIPSSRTISVVSSRQNSPSPIQEEQHHQGSVGSSPSIFYLGRAAKPSATLQVRETSANHALLEIRQVDQHWSEDDGGSVFDDVESIDGLVREFHAPACFSPQRPHSASLHSQDDDAVKPHVSSSSMYEAEVPVEEEESEEDDESEKEEEDSEEEDVLPVVYLRGEMSVLMDEEEDDGGESTLPNSPAMSSLEMKAPIQFEQDTVVTKVREGHKIKWMVSLSVFVMVLAMAMQFMCTSIQDVKEFLAWTVLLAMLLYAGCVR